MCDSITLLGISIEDCFDTPAVEDNASEPKGYVWRTCDVTQLHEKSRFFLSLSLFWERDEGGIKRD